MPRLSQPGEENFEHQNDKLFCIKTPGCGTKNVEHICCVFLLIQYVSTCLGNHFGFGDVWECFVERLTTSKYSYCKLVCAHVI